MRPALVLTIALLAGALVSPAQASREVRYGIQDDAWLSSGSGTLAERLDTLEGLGVRIVRYTLRWDRIAARRPQSTRWHADPAYEWGAADAVLEGLRARRIHALVTLVGTPPWANGGRSSNWAPSGRAFGDFAYAAATRYHWVRDWLVWNEPNQRRWLRPTSARVYVQRLLNPALAALHLADRRNRVGGGVTAPRGNAGGVSPVAWIRGMRAARARLDAYAHHPYPRRRSEAPTSRGCGHCSTITMATLDRLLAEVKRAFGPKRIWLTEYAYQTNPPDRLLGVSPATQARYLAEAAHKVYRAPRVDMLIHFLVRDDTDRGGWQSGLFAPNGSPKPARSAYMLPLAQSSRSGARAVIWGQVRPRTGRQSYRLRIHRHGRWSWLGGIRRTDSHGFFTVSLNAERGARVQAWSPRDRMFSPALGVR